MVVAGLYRRVLPSPPAIEFASPEGKSLFTEALGDGTMEGFFKLISYYQTQSEPAYCGPTTLSMVLNALSIDPGRKWKGPWRWFDDSMFDCCEPLEKIKSKGITFGKVAWLAHCNGANVDAFRTNESTVDGFRNCVVACCSLEDCNVISSYHRGVLKQTGTGHFSPIGGYHAGRDMVLILDVARFKYPPHWVPLTLLWDAMNTIDEATGHHRGYMVISRRDRAPSNLYTAEEVVKLVRETELFKRVSRLLTGENSLCKETECSGENGASPEVAAKFCCQVAQILAGKVGSAHNLCCREIVVKLLEGDGERPVTTNGSEQPSDLGAIDQGSCIGMPPSTADLLTLILLALPEQTWSGIKEENLREAVTGLLTADHLPTLLQDEVLHLRRQIHFLMTDLEAPKLA